MTSAAQSAQGPGLRFTLRELSGGLGDLGTLLPLAVAMAVTTGMDFGLYLLMAGLLNIAVGLVFRQPLPVQPTKAIAAAAIYGGLTAGEVTASGLLLGVLMIVFALSGVVSAADRYIPRALVRGIQAGVGIKLIWQGVSWIGELPTEGWNSVGVACVVLGLIILAKLLRSRIPMLLIAFLLGFVILALVNGSVYRSVTISLPNFGFFIPAPDEWWGGFTEGALPQLPLTLLNSVIAVCALSTDYYPKHGVPPKRMALSVGVINLVTVPFGGMPVCHGSGGLAAHYGFGARTGGAVIMLGSGMVAIALLLGGALIDLAKNYPRAVLGAMVIVAGWSLASAARPSLTGRDLFLVMATAAPIVFFNTLIGFLCGVGLALVFVGHDAWRRR